MIRKRILITGGAGFIGGSLIRRLLKNEDYLIFNLDKIGYASDLSSINNMKNNHLHFHMKVDLSNSFETDKALNIANPDIIIHLAAESHVDRSIDSPEIFLKSNILGTFNLLESTRKYWNNLKGNKKEKFRFHHVSTDEVFGTLSELGKFNEKSPYSPRSPYSATKASSDHLVESWGKTYNLPILITNCSNNYGPFQFPEKLIPLSILKAINGEPIPLYGDGKNIRDWLYVEDHVDAILLVLEKGKIGNRYCIGGNEEKTNKEILTFLCNLLDVYKPNGSPYSQLIQHVDDRPGHDRRYSIDTTFIENELDWKPKYSLNEGLEKTVKWYLNNLDWCTSILNISGYNVERLGINS